MKGTSSSYLLLVAFFDADPGPLAELNPMGSGALTVAMALMRF